MIGMATCSKKSSLSSWSSSPSTRWKEMGTFSGSCANEIELLLQEMNSPSRSSLTLTITLTCVYLQLITSIPVPFI